MVSLVAGIVVMAAPAVSVATLTSLVGAWFVVMGLLEMFGALLLRHAAHNGDTGGTGDTGARKAAEPRAPPCPGSAPGRARLTGGWKPSDRRPAGAGSRGG